ncbi:hypothetical protein B0H17DRAFT_1129565 [Mycena rosella]|uniref:Uncharacterized protein n=1 Tax=Mycena rosella TaxID=1033263 RepID=A0AAD7DVV8_MYCRO|nr:hypothetical protein B0H17DRAFT_1129565 [Mycena rosella]
MPLPTRRRYCPNKEPSTGVFPRTESEEKTGIVSSDRMALKNSSIAEMSRSRDSAQHSEGNWFTAEIGTGESLSKRTYWSPSLFNVGKCDTASRMNPSGSRQFCRTRLAILVKDVARNAEFRVNAGRSMAMSFIFSTRRQTQRADEPRDREGRRFDDADKRPGCAVIELDLGKATISARRKPIPADEATLGDCAPFRVDVCSEFAEKEIYNLQEI